MTRERVGVGITVLGGAVFEAQLTLGQLKSPSTTQSDRREMMVSSEQIRDMLSGGGVFGLRYTRAIVAGSELKSSQHTIRLSKKCSGGRGREQHTLR